MSNQKAKDAIDLISHLDFLKTFPGVRNNLHIELELRGEVEKEVEVLPKSKVEELLEKHGLK